MATLDRTRIWIGLDDTDTPDSGCTTSTFDDLLKSTSHLNDFEIIERRLVRLWPFAERRTRGNGALSCIIECSTDSLPEFETAISSFFNELEDTLNSEGGNYSLTSPALIYSFEELDEEMYLSLIHI